MMEREGDQEIVISHPQPHRKLFCGLGRFLLWREDKGMRVCVGECEEAAGQQNPQQHGRSRFKAPTTGIVSYSPMEVNQTQKQPIIK